MLGGASLVGINCRTEIAGGATDPPEQKGLPLCLSSSEFFRQLVGTFSVSATLALPILAENHPEEAGGGRSARNWSASKDGSFGFGLLGDRCR